MPLLDVTVTPNAIGDEHVERFIESLTDAACRAESLPADALHRSRCVLMYNERPTGSVRFGGHVADELIRAVFIRYTVSEGVLDPVRRSAFAAAVHGAATAAASDDARLLHTSVVFDEVNEGRWGRDGRIVRLPEMAAVAGFEHLVAIVSP
jgi:phenylpyruvate tautomerase PptA (4-oxalocrotonate tautomerase family)